MYFCESVTPSSNRRQISIKVNNQRKKNGLAVDTAEQRGAERPSAFSLSAE